MKKIKTVILTAFTMAILTGCGETQEQPQKQEQPQQEQTEQEEKPVLEIVEYPKTTFYCGEKFSNDGIILRVNPENGESFLTEKVTTSKIETKKEGTQEVKIFYTDEEHDIDTYVKYEIKVIDWTKEEKAIFAETSISSMSRVYYPKMEGMQLLTETDDKTNQIVDYWIEKKNSNLQELNEYTRLLDNYSATRRIVQNGESYDITFKFYEQARVPSDYRDLYDEHDLVCYKYCASVSYMGPDFLMHEGYANEIEDTVVIGLNDSNDLIVRFIADSVYLESLFGLDVNERLNYDILFNGVIVNDLNDKLKGYYDEESNEYVPGYLDAIGPMAKDYIVFPNYEPDIALFNNYASIFPWLHGEDDLCFEIQICSDDVEQYENFIADIEKIGDFVKTTRTEKIGRDNITYTTYTIENLDYVGDLVIEVSEMIDDAMSYSTLEGNIRQTYTVDAYTVYYRWSKSEMFSPALQELFNIYESFYGKDNYDPTRYDIYEKGTVGGLVQFESKDGGIDCKEAAATEFANKCLNGYTSNYVNKIIEIGGRNIAASEYENGNFKIVIYSYYDSGKYNVEFSVEILEN